MSIDYPEKEDSLLTYKKAIGETLGHRMISQVNAPRFEACVQYGDKQ